MNFNTETTWGLQNHRQRSLSFFFLFFFSEYFGSLLWDEPAAMSSLGKSKCSLNPFPCYGYLFYFFFSKMVLGLLSCCFSAVTADVLPPKRSFKFSICLIFISLTRKCQHTYKWTLSYSALQSKIKFFMFYIDRLRFANFVLLTLKWRNVVFSFGFFVSPLSSFSHYVLSSVCFPSTSADVSASWRCKACLRCQTSLKRSFLAAHKTWRMFS